MVFGDFQNDDMRSSTDPLLSETTIAGENHYQKQALKVSINYTKNIEQRKKYLFN